MSDELTTRLQTARSQYMGRNFEACLKTLASCPQDDPKVIHNTAITRHVMKPSNFRGVLAKLGLPAVQRVKSLKTGQLVPTVTLQYEGQELALVNAAALLIHNGANAEARQILLALSSLSSAFSPAVRARMAMLLHVASRRIPNNAEISEVTSGLMGDVASSDSDGSLSALMEVAFSDTSMLHSWFAKTSKSPVERALYLNNLGVEAFADGKPSIAGVFFARAAKGCGPDACPFLADSIAYNSAVCALARGGNGEGAAAALLRAQGTMSGSAMLWIRLGQALITTYQAATRDAELVAYEAKILDQVKALYSGGSSYFPAIPPQLTSVPKGTTAILMAASQPLQNAIGVLVEKGEKLVDAARRLAHPGSDSALLLDSALSMLAYVELCRCNYGVVASIANDYSVIERDVKSATTARSQAVMACYHVEALCAANRSSQALRLLQSMNLGHFISAKAPNSTVEALMLNVCAAYIMNGQWTKAIQLSQQLLAKIPAPVSQLLVAYIELAQGNRVAAAEIIESLPQQPIELR